uniref:Glycoprotein B n=1 Tax=Anatid alphaherpesvirus 2 TaxID=3080522 RepID=A0AAU0K711_9ALPH
MTVLACAILSFTPVSGNSTAAGGGRAAARNGNNASRSSAPVRPTPGSIPARDVVSGIQITPEEASFYVCPPPAGSTVVRFEPPRTCPKAHTGREWTEGIGVIFKENILPYKFKATIYYKNVIQTTTWAGSTYRQITNRFTDRTPVDVEEINELIDGKGKCLSRARYLRNNYHVDAFDRDAAAEEVPLKASRFSTPESRAWHTTNDTYTVFGSPWVYRTGTSVNCIVEEIDARSAFPYTYFALANGDVVDMSPFYGYTPEDATFEHIGYSLDRFRQYDGYIQMNLDTKVKEKVPVRRNFLTTTEFTVGWNWAPKMKRVCSMARWKSVDEMLRAKYDENRIRFMAKSLSATFLSNATQFNPDTILLGQCVRKDAEEEISRIFAASYNDTHVRSGPIEYYLAVGGFVIAYQPIMSKTLAGMYIRELLRDNRTDVVADLLGRQNRNGGGAAAASGGGRSANGSASRQRREVRQVREVKMEEINETTIIKSTSSAQFAMLQFLYDNIQAHVNDMFSRIAVAWCELQNKEAVLWHEGLKLNPSAIASANMGFRVGARLLGDVLAVSSCIRVDPDSVTLQNSMRVTTSTKTCYSRPLVLFSYNTDNDKVEGQLGENNELMPTTEAVEPCAANHKRYFLFGNRYAYFEDYTFIRMVDPADVPMISTFVELNLTMLEDREILPLTVYTKEEIRDSGVLDYTEVARRNQLHELKFYDIDKVIEVDSNYAFMAGLAEVFNGLGEAGKAIGKVVVGAAGAVVSTVSGIASFISNPFGGLAIGLVVVAAIVAAFLAYRYISRLRRNPMKALYPITTKDLKDKAAGGRSQGDGADDDEEEFDEEKLQLARDMVRYMALLSAEERQEKKLRKRKRGSSALLSNHLTKLRLRNKQYSELKNETTDDEFGESNV